MRGTEQLLFEGAAHFNLVLTEAQLAAFEQYHEALIFWNEKFNLTRIVEPEAVVVKHFLDSLTVFPALAGLPEKPAMLDIGSGAGFPGLPLKIAWPELELTLLEATAKKSRFLEYVVEKLGLGGVRVVTARAEEAAHQAAFREQFDVAVARAVAPLPVLAEYGLPFVRRGGRFIAQKGQNPASEVAAAANALRVLGGRLGRVQAVETPGLEAERCLVIIEKVRATPKEYPRRPGVPAKSPL